MAATVYEKRTQITMFFVSVICEQSFLKLDSCLKHMTFFETKKKNSRSWITQYGRQVLLKIAENYDCLRLGNGLTDLAEIA